MSLLLTLEAFFITMALMLGSSRDLNTIDAHVKRTTPLHIDVLNQPSSPPPFGLLGLPNIPLQPSQLSRRLCRRTTTTVPRGNYATTHTSKTSHDTASMDALMHSTTYANGVEGIMPIDSPLHSATHTSSDEGCDIGYITDMQEQASSKVASMLAEDVFTDASTSNDSLPVICILGPPGCGKGTLSKSLSAHFNLYHLSTGDWLRSQARPPIAGVSDRINGYMSAGEAVPQNILTEEYSNPDDVPPALILSNCSKLGISTPSEMWLRALPALKDEFERTSKASDRPCAILLDNFPKTIEHAEAAGEVFGAGFPSLVIHVVCSEEVAGARFLKRGRGSDDEDVFKRRFARSSQGMPAVMAYYERTSCVLRADTSGTPTEACEGLLAALEGTPTWQRITEAASDTQSEEG